MRRRHFLGWSLFGLAAFSTPLVASRLIAGEPDEGAELARGFFRDSRTARRIGARYLELNPEKANPGSLRALSVDRAGRLFPAGKDVNRSLQLLIQHDFAVGNTVLVDGWVLSESEAALCSLLALS